MEGLASKMKTNNDWAKRNPIRLKMTVSKWRLEHPEEYNEQNFRHYLNQLRQQDFQERRKGYNRKYYLRKKNEANNNK